MSDSSDDVETFESADAGAAPTFPLEAGQIKKGGYIMIKDQPCKVTNVAVSKTGKHGHAKCNFEALHIFNGKKYTEISSSTHTLPVPNIFRAEYSLLDIGEDGELSLMTDSGDTKDDLNMPEDEQLKKQIQTQFDDGKQLLVSVLSACGVDQVMSFKEDTN
jgi:translation initiation factor 5A